MREFKGKVCFLFICKNVEYNEDDDDDDREGVVLNTQREKIRDIKNTFHAMCNNVKS